MGLHGLKSTKTSLTALVILQCELEGLSIEIGPAEISDMNLGIGQLPEQEIADPLLAAGPNQQIRIRLACSEQLCCQGILIDLRWLQLSPSNAFRQSLAGTHQLTTTSVIGADVEVLSLIHI